MALPRQMLCYWLRYLTSFTLIDIGAFINKDYTTVMYSIKQIKNLISQNDKDCMLLYNTLKTDYGYTEQPEKEEY